MRLVPATVDQIALLRDLTYRAKASWGYDAEFMALIYSDIDLTPEMFERDTLMTAVQHDRVLGYAQLKTIDRPDTLYLENLYVEPEAQGKGIGRLLIEWAFAEAARQGFDWLEWDSDPNAAPFYVRMGGETNRRNGIHNPPRSHGPQIPQACSTWCVGPSVSAAGCSLENQDSDECNRTLGAANVHNGTRYPPCRVSPNPKSICEGKRDDSSGRFRQSLRQ